MKLSIFSRLIIGFLIVLFLMMAVSLYAVLKLHHFNADNRYIMNIDNRLMDLKKKLVDSILSQRRFEEEYVATKDILLYNQYVSAKSEFNKYLVEARLLADTTPQRDSLDRVKMWYDRYQSLIEKEDKFVREGQGFNRNLYEQEQEKGSTEILKELENLEGFAWRDMSNRMKILVSAGAAARNLAIIMAIASMVLGIGISFLIMRSITHPLTILMKKTEQVSEGIYESNLYIPSPPEMSKLAKAFNLMCEKLKAIDKMKSDFFSTVSHELRMPLISIKEGTNFLSEDLSKRATDKQERLLAILSEESDRLINMVNSLLDLSKMEAGMMTYTFQRANLESLINQATLEMSPLLEAKKIVLDTRIEGEVPSVEMDVDRILQVLRNLVGNAVKFTPGGGHVRVLVRSIDGGVEVSVTDTGPGIPSEHLATIFNKFEQVAHGGSSRTKGTGLGLAIVKHIIKSHGGKVWAESKLGEGSKFIFVLPSGLKKDFSGKPGGSID